MEQNKEMTAQESLKLITETMNNNRKEIVRSNGKYYVMWGILLTVFSLLVYFLWESTGKAAWNNLWFALPVIGFPMARLIAGKNPSSRAENYISRITGGVWATFGLFACSVALVSVLYGLFGTSPLAGIVMMASITAQIVVLFGMAETICGIALKNWTIQIAGFLTGIGGMAIYFITGANEEQMFIFTFAGVVLAATGLVIKHQYK